MGFVNFFSRQRHPWQLGKMQLPGPHLKEDSASEELRWGPGICVPLLSAQGNLDADGSQITGKEFVPEPPGGCGWTSEGRRETFTSERMGMAGRQSTESAGEGDNSKSSCLLSTWHAPDFLLMLAAILQVRKLKL